MGFPGGGTGRGPPVYYSNNPSGAGDLIQAMDAGAFDWSDARTLADVMDNGMRGVGPVLCKSVGHSFWDLAAARLALTYP